MSWRDLIGHMFQDAALLWPRRMLYALCFLAVFGDFIANERPVYCAENGRSYSPMIRGMLVDAGLMSWPEGLLNRDWMARDFEKAAYTIIPYSPGSLDAENSGYVSPLSKQDVSHWRFRHWLGTDSVGRDVTAGLIRGCRVALVVGLFSMALALLIGLPLGLRAGYFGNDRMRIGLPVALVWGVVSLLSAWYVWQAIVSAARFSERSLALDYLFIGSCIVLAGFLAEYVLQRVSGRSGKMPIPVDGIVMRGVEVVRSVPPFFLLFALLGMITSPGIWWIVFIVGLLRAPTIIRYVRAESLRLRDETFIDAARVIGLADSVIIFRHILPNAIGPVVVTVAFGIAGAVLLESGLSFLGLGLGIEEVTWGRQLSEARKNFSAWWLAILPGLAIYITVSVFNRMGSHFSALLRG